MADSTRFSNYTLALFNKKPLVGAVNFHWPQLVWIALDFFKELIQLNASCTYPS